MQLRHLYFVYLNMGFWTTIIEYQYSALARVSLIPTSEQESA